MENHSSNNNNNNNQQVFDPMPINACPPSSESSNQSIGSTLGQNVESSFFSSSVTPLKNRHMYDPEMKRLTHVKRLARIRNMDYPKYGPYPCRWCINLLPTSQSFAGHMRAHYKRAETAEKAEKQAQQPEQLLTPEQQQAKELADAQAVAEEELVTPRSKAERQAQLLAKISEKAEAKAKRPKLRPRGRTAARAPAPARARAPAPEPTYPLQHQQQWHPDLAGQHPLRTNDCHLRLSNCQFGQIISPGNKDNSVSKESISNAMDFILYSRRRPVIPNSSPGDVLHYHHNLQAPPHLASSSRPRPFMYVNQISPVVVKQEPFSDEDMISPPPGFHHLQSSEGPSFKKQKSSEGPSGGNFIIKQERVEFVDDDLFSSGLSDKLALKL